MSTDYTKFQMSSERSSQKVLLQGTGTINVPSLSSAGEVWSTATIPHGFGSDKLLAQVSTLGVDPSPQMIPWQSNDGRIVQWLSIDSKNLYITVNSNDSSGFGSPGFSVTYHYRILIP